MTKDGAPEGGSTSEVVDCGNVQVRVVDVGCAPTGNSQ